MPATRLLVVADPKMLPALANGLRISGRFEIATAPFAEPKTLLPLTANAEVVALFYGSRAWPLPAQVQELAAEVRARGARLIAVLQKDQALLRDDCFRAGASDLLFMPMPKDQFSARLFESASLSFAEEPGLAALVSLSHSQQPASLLDAMIAPGGVTIASGPELAAGATVQLSWQASVSFARWGLVVQSGIGGLRIRFAGASSDEDAQVRAWVKGQPIPALAPIPERIPTSPGVAPASAAANSTAPRMGAQAIPATVADVKVIPPTVMDVKAVPPTVMDVKAVPPTVMDVQAIAPTLAEARAAGGPLITPTGTARLSTSSPGGAVPPGFAARPPIRPQSIRTNPGGNKPRDTSPGAPSETGEHRPVSSNSNPGGGPLITPAKANTPVSGSKASAGSAAATGAADSGQTALAGAAAAMNSPGAGRIATPPRPIATLGSPPAGSAPVSSPGAAASPSSTAADASQSAPAAAKSSGLESLFEEPAAAAGAGAPPPAEMAPLPNWPTPLDAALAKSLLTLMLKEKSLPAEAPADPAAAVRKVVGAMPSIDRESLDAAAADSHLHEALVARVQLVHANSEGQLLVDKSLGALVDDAAVTALLQTTETASKRLQAEADRAIAKGEVEALQQVTASSAALSRELLSFKETVDRLHGLALAPRLGAGALDPTMVAPDAPKPIARKEKSEARVEQRRLALSDFTGLQDTPKAATQKRWLVLGLVVLVVSIGNAIWFVMPQVSNAAAPMVEQAGTGVLDITYSGPTAIVSISPIWTQAYDRKARVQSICDALAPKGVQKAMIYVDGKGMIGQIDVARCESIGLPPPKPPPPELGGPEQPGGK